VTIEAADVWFGVTMQEPGVSTIIPFKTAGRELAETIVPGPFLK
jgi:chromosome segregation ATPase